MLRAVQGERLGLLPESHQTPEIHVSGLSVSKDLEEILRSEKMLPTPK